MPCRRREEGALGGRRTAVGIGRAGSGEGEVGDGVGVGRGIGEGDDHFTSRNFVMFHFVFIHC